MMTEQSEKKILLAVDGSENALEIIRYVAKIPIFRKRELVLFHVHSKIPDSYWDLGKSGSAAWRIAEARAWEAEREKAIKKYMDKALKILQREGFSSDQIKVKMHQRKKGFARDIVKEAQNGYEGVFVGRKGMSNLKDLVLGSIATKLIEKIAFVPILVVGKRPLTGSVLLALDGSDNAMRAVEYAGNLLGGPDVKARLIHVIRSDHSEYVEQRKTEIGAFFDDASEVLEASGFESSHISTRIVTGVRSRAVTIMEEAREEGYGTIVVGRKGLSRVRDFLLGTVSNKLIHLARNQAVWVVN